MTPVLGPNSPLRTAAKVRRALQPSEEDTQIALMALLVGPCRPGEGRRPGDGMTGRFPALGLLYAIPNGGARSKRTAARLKAQGVLAGMPDLHLPVARGPFLSLYVELKVPGRYGRPVQRAMAELLRAQGHCVLECQGVQEATDAILGYLDQHDREPVYGGTLLRTFEAGSLDSWRRYAHAVLTPRRR